ncbi:MAG: cation diffusion facilitator family transporter [Zetaproteobacteria bacterium]|nr:MAG: cation diffusion facilitator family transporter [Zetaproteobacteria bacterium]
MRWATYASTGTAGLLILVKLVAWLMTDAVSILATLIDSCLDALASLLNLFAVRHALAPADKQHRFGHGKAESLAGLAQATFIAGSALFLLLQAGVRLWHPQPVAAMGVGVGVMLFSMLATLALVAFQSYVVRHSGSMAIKGDHLHYKTDLLVNAGVIAALVLAAYGWPGFDPVLAMLIAGYIVHSAWEIARESFDHLMDKELSVEERADIRRLVLAHPDVRGMHDLRTRRAGAQVFIQLHLELDDELPLIKAHAISDEVEARLLEAFPQAEVLIHEDPASLMEQVPDFAADERARKQDSAT